MTSITFCHSATVITKKDFNNVSIFDGFTGFASDLLVYLIYIELT